MKQKIEWYQEVLEIEPNSGLFFPLAKMLAQDGQTGKAIATLRAGTARHPDHLEARLLLIEMLFTHGSRDALWEEIDAVGALFSAYPNFWQAWGERLHASEAGKDAGIALFLFAAGLRHERISWPDIIGNGLLSLLSQKAPGKPALVPMAAARPATPQESAPQAPEIPEDEAPTDPHTEVEAAPSSTPVESAPEKDPSLAQSAGDEEEQEEPFSLRTRSMADILAEQGDIQGALEIYKELLAVSSSDQEKAALQARMDELTLKQASSTSPGTASAPAKSDEAEPRNRLADMLEALAQRLESRSLQ